MDPRPIYIIGFMAAGKSTVGRLVADRMGREFVDLDQRVEEAAGRSVTEIFAAEGESGFRRAESAALDAIADLREVVVACGGGTPCFSDNMRRMRASGIVVALSVSLDEVMRRVGSGAGRPLLAGGGAVSATAARLYREREAVYRAADAVVATDGLTPGDVAAEVQRRASLRMGAVNVRLAERSYPVHDGPLADVGTLARELLGPPGKRLAIVTDDNVARAGHAAAVRLSLDAAGFEVDTIAVAPGEGSKNLAEVGRIAQACVERGLDRSSAIIAVGGGVVGDLAGFAAAVLFRGVAYAQVPTSLLAMLDSSVGGKTGVDLPAGKNLVGAFWQPSFVLCDVSTLATLPARERRAALGEALKIGLLFDPELWGRLEAEGEGVDVRELVRRCVRAKAAVVSRDEREESGERALLNLGHTLGHAIEAASGYRLLHGEAVALGLVAAARVSAAMGLCDRALPERVHSAVGRVGLDAGLDGWLRDDVRGFLAADKKRAGAAIRFIALEAVGRPRAVDLTPDELWAFLRAVPRR